MVRKRRRTKYTWMPTLGGEATVGDASYNTTHFGATVSVQNTAAGPTGIYVTPIVPDFTPHGLVPAEAQDTLRDLTEGQDWLLKRIVGKIHIAAGQFTEVVSTAKVMHVCAAFFVARAEATFPDLPDMLPQEYDPLGAENVRQPWIWRRKWVVMNGLAGSPTAGVILEVNNQNTSGLDGPHIDSKITRRIRREERLFFVLNAYGENRLSGVPAASPFAEPGQLEFSLDYRVLGQMRRSNNRSTF